MKGREVFRHAVVNLADVLNEVLAAGLTAADVDWVVPHQANARSSTRRAKKLGLPRKGRRHRRPACQHLGGLGAAGARHGGADGRIKRGDLVVLEAMGGGFTWGAAALRY
jgi:3-oxoacyl-[acyl-carrier-protein] synthase-3